MTTSPPSIRKENLNLIGSVVGGISFAVFFSMLLSGSPILNATVGGLLLGPLLGIPVGMVFAIGATANKVFQSIVDTSANTKDRR